MRSRTVSKPMHPATLHNILYNPDDFFRLGFRAAASTSASARNDNSSCSGIQQVCREAYILAAGAPCVH